MGHTDSPLCSYCQKANETTKHLFFECPLTQKVWKELQNYLKNYLTLPCLELQSAIVGFLEKSHDDQILINSILLTFKMLLYKNRESKRFNLTQIVKNIKSREKIESAIARESGKLLFHSRKWQILKDIL